MDTSKARSSRRHRPHSPAIESLEPRRLMSGTWSTVDTIPSQIGPYVTGMAADKAGNVYAVGWELFGTTSYLREKPAGSAAWTTVATMNGGQYGDFDGVAVDVSGDVFVTGRNSSGYFATWEVAKGTTTLQQIDVTGGGGAKVTTDQSGNVYVVGTERTKYKGGTTDRWTVRKGTFSGGKWTFSTVDQPLQSQGNAYGVTVAPSGIYVVGKYNGNWTIRKSATGATGTWTPIDSTTGAASGGIATDAAGNIYVAGSSTTNHWVVRESTNGGSSWTTVDDLLGTFLSAGGSAITRDGSGNMVVAGWAWDSVGDEHAVVRTNAGGSWTTLDDYSYPAGNAQYNAVAADSFGNLYAGGELNDNAGTFDDWMIRSQPAAPTNLRAADDASNSTSQINLTWANAAGSDETGFAIYRSSDGGATFTLLASLSAGATTYADTGLTAGTTYSYYIVTLLNSDGASNASNTATATTATA